MVSSALLCVCAVFAFAAQPVTRQFTQTHWVPTQHGVQGVHKLLCEPAGVLINLQPLVVDVDVHNDEHGTYAYHLITEAIPLPLGLGHIHNTVNVTQQIDSAHSVSNTVHGIGGGRWLFAADQRFTLTPLPHDQDGRDGLLVSDSMNITCPRILVDFSGTQFLAAHATLLQRLERHVIDYNL